MFVWGAIYSVNMLRKATSDNSKLCYFRLRDKDLCKLQYIVYWLNMICILYNPPPIKNNGIYFAFSSSMVVINCMVFEKVLVFFFRGVEGGICFCVIWG